MPYALIIARTILTVAGVRNTHASLYALLEGDFTGQGSFIWWTLSILAIGAVGYIPDLKKLSSAFMTLILIVLFISNSKSGEGVVQKFMDALRAPIPPAPVANSASTATSKSSSPLSSLGSGLSGFMTSWGIPAL